MPQLVSVWVALDARRRVIVGLAAIAMFIAVFGLSRLATSPNLSLLYSGLEPATSGQVIKSLEQEGIVFEIRGNSIFVDATRRDQLRMKLASEGLPANNGQGYELLDNLSGFGTTAQMFDAAYWRAKEGELARTISASPQFSGARVHISNTASRPFKRSARPSASVTVTGFGGVVSGAHAKAIRFLVSSAVAGMLPDDVSIIDGTNGIVVPDENEVSGLANGSSRAIELKQSIERLLEARVGLGNAIVEVFLDIETESETVTERTFDPDSRVAISSEKQERSTNSNNTRGGNVTVASNLPDGAGAANGNESSNQDSETSERINYEVSETTRELLRGPGTIRRLSIAVLVDGVFEQDANTNTLVWEPRNETEITALRELVASASGFDEGRGDTLTLKSLQFQTADNSVQAVEFSVFQKLNIDVMRLIQLAVLSIVSLVLGLLVVRPALTTIALPAPAQGNNIPSLAAPSMPNGALAEMSSGQTPVTAALTGEIDERSSLPVGLETVQNIQSSGLGIESQATLAVDPVERLRTMIADRQDETVDILKTWIDGNEERV
ncbi:MAG: flagellar basal-body MS-ring/collar protein FliF [Paracoccaceae bacterium]